MPFQKTVKDIMIPLERYPAVHPDATLKEAVQLLRISYCTLNTGYCAETGPRTLLVVDAGHNLVGILDFRAILRVLIPEVTGGLTAKLESIGVSIAYAEVEAESLDEARAQIVARVTQNAQTRVGDVMRKVRGTIQADAGLMEALKLLFKNKITKIPVFEGSKLIGIVRDTDLFLEMADLMMKVEE
jgi:CBS domain-containing protein